MLHLCNKTILYSYYCFSLGKFWHFSAFFVQIHGLLCGRIHPGFLQDAPQSPRDISRYFRSCPSAFHKFKGIYQYLCKVKSIQLLKTFLKTHFNTNAATSYNSTHVCLPKERRQGSMEGSSPGMGRAPARFG